MHTHTHTHPNWASEARCVLRNSYPALETPGDTLVNTDLTYMIAKISDLFFFALEVVLKHVGDFKMELHDYK